MPETTTDLNPTLVSEEHSQKELASTVVCRPVAIGLGACFCALLLLPVLVQTASQGAGGSLFSEFGGLDFPPTRESLQVLGRKVDEASVLKRWVQPALQSVLSGAGGFGNEKVTIASSGWLYYSPGLRYISGHGFLSPAHLRAKAKAMIDKDGLETAHPDPLPAFQQLAEDCRRLGIRLYLLPVPDKGMVVTAPLAAGMRRDALQNPDFARFRQTVESYGAEVIPVETFAEDAYAPWYLRQDTHWTPRWMDRVAQGVAERLRAAGLGAPGGAPARYRRRERHAQSHGDLVAMLKLPGNQSLFPKESVQVQEVLPVDPATGDDAEVLLLGDSFTNIYSSASLDWGERAGLGEQLAYHLNAPVEIIARNGAGASVRQELVRAARTGRLGRTRALVYEFAIRDLYLEDWPPVRIGDVHRPPPTVTERRAPEPEAPKPAAAENKAEPKPEPAPAADTREVTVTGTLTQLSRPIDPAVAPYEDGLLYGKLRVDRVSAGSYGKPEMIVVFLAMQKRVLQPGANHRAGEVLKLKLVTLRSAPEAVRGMQRSDDTEDYDLTPYFVLEELH